MVLLKRLPAISHPTTNIKIPHSLFHCDYCDSDVVKVHNAGLHASTCGNVTCVRKNKVEQANLKYPTSKMERVKDLGIIKTKPGRFEHMSIYKCPTCSDEITIRFSDGVTQKSCSKKGCIAANVVRKRSYTSNTTHGMSSTKLYHVWQAMIKRCKPENKNNPSYKSYAGKGITVCDKWLTFEGFYEDMGKGYEEFTAGDSASEAPSIDRIDSNGNYELSNCQWISQGTNSSKDRKIPLVQLTKEGEFIARFTDSYHAAREAIGHDDSRVIAEKVNAVMNGNRKTHAGCVWKREDEHTVDTKSVVIDTLMKPTQLDTNQGTPKARRMIAQLNDNMEVIAEFTNHVEAGLSVGISRGMCNRINEVCKGTRNMCGGFRWKYKDELPTDDGSELFTFWYNSIRVDCSNAWKDYNTFKVEVGAGTKLVKDNVNKAWSASNFKWVDESYIKNDTSTRRVLQLTNTRDRKDASLIAKYTTTVEAEKATGVANANIRAVCTGKRNSAGGFRWEYLS